MLKIKLMQTKKNTAAARLDEMGFILVAVSTRRYKKTADVIASAKLVIASIKENF